MEIEKTMEFIVEQQAAMTARQDSILKFIKGGMKLIAGHDHRIAAQASQIESHDVYRYHSFVTGHARLPIFG